MATLQDMAKTNIQKMKKLEDRIEAAWQKSRGEESYDSDYPVKASQNFIDGYLAGTKDSLANQWHSMKDEVPKTDGRYLTLFRVKEEQTYDKYMIEIAPWRNGKYQGAYCMNVHFGQYIITHWMPIPKISITDI